MGPKELLKTLEKIEEIDFSCDSEIKVEYLGMSYEDIAEELKALSKEREKLFKVLSSAFIRYCIVNKQILSYKSNHQNNNMFID